MRHNGRNVTQNLQQSPTDKASLPEKNAPQELLAQLGQLRADLIWISLLRGLSLFLFFLFGLLAPGLWLLGHFSFAPAWAWTWLGACGLAATLLLLRGVRRLQQGQSTLALGRRLEQHFPQLQDKLTTSLHLLQEIPQGQSIDLSQVHIEQSLRRLLSLNATSTLRHHMWRKSAPVFSLGLGVVLLSLAIQAAWPQTLQNLPNALRGPKAGAQPLSTLPPMVTDLVLEYHYPAYMQRAVQRMEGSSGEIHAPLGSEVIISGRSDRPLLSAAVELGGKHLAAALQGPRQLSVKLPIDGDGRYYFVLDTAQGQRVERQGHAIATEEDRSPEVQLRAPADDLVVHQDQTVQIHYQARDDFGLTELFVVVQKLNGEIALRRSLEKVDGRLSALGGETDLEIASLGAAPGDRLRLFVEASDNDSISGPKIGRSPQRVLKIFSASEHHQELMSALRKVFDQLVGNLADDMEQPLDEKQHRKELRESLEKAQLREQAFGKTLQAMTQLIGQFADDRLAPLALLRALRNAQRELEPLHEIDETLLHVVRRAIGGDNTSPTGYLMRLSDNQKQRIRTLEKHVLYLDDLYNRERINTARLAAERLREGQRKLSDLLQKYQQETSEALRQEILAAIDQLENEMRELQRNLASMRRDISDQYVNHEALRADDLSNPLQRIRELLAEGKIEEARKALERMQQLSQEQRERMDKASQDFGGEAYAKQRQKLSKLWDNINTLEQRQRELLKDNAQRYQQAVKKLRKAMGQDLQKLAKKLAARARSTQKKLNALPNQKLASYEEAELAKSQDRLGETARALDTQDFSSALDSARNSAESQKNLALYLDQRARMQRGRGLGKVKQMMQKNRAAGQDIQKLVEALEALFPSAQNKLSPQEQQALRKQAQTQHQLEKQAQRAQQELESLAKDLPIFSPEHRQMLREAKGHMQQAAQQLESQDRRQAVGQQREALSQLGALQQAMQDLGKQGGEGGQGIPLPWASTGDGREGQGGSGRGAERVEIPKEAQDQAPAAFRRDILDAMKEAPPESFKDQVRRYYEELVK